MGKRGPQPGSGGRPKKPLAEKIADEVLFLEDGRILEDTPGKDFFKNPQTARAREFLDSMDF